MTPDFPHPATMPGPPVSQLPAATPPTVPAGLAVLPVTGIGEVRPGDDLAARIVQSAPWLTDGDVVVVTSKIVSKAEGQLVPVPLSGPEREAARAAVLADQTARTVASRGSTRIVQTHHGFVMASAGVDASNVDRSQLVLLPVDPDGSARHLRAELRARYGLDVAVLISDTMGRPWRSGLTDVALGAAGLDPLRDYRGQLDPYGNELHITQMAVVDEICAAAELVKNKYDQIPVAVVRGLAVTGTPDGPGVAVLIRPAEQDLFWLGTAEARVSGLEQAAGLEAPDAFAATPVKPDLVRSALDRLGSADLILLSGGTRDKALEQVGLAGSGAELVLGCGPGAVATQPAACAAIGADLHRLRILVHAAGLASAWLTADASHLVAVAGLGGGRVGVGVVAIGYPA